MWSFFRFGGNRIWPSSSGHKMQENTIIHVHNAFALLYLKNTMKVHVVINNQCDFVTCHWQTVKRFWLCFAALNTESHCAGTGEGCGVREPGPLYYQRPVVGLAQKRWKFWRIGGLVVWSKGVRKCAKNYSLATFSFARQRYFIHKS